MMADLEEMYDISEAEIINIIKSNRTTVVHKRIIHNKHPLSSDNHQYTTIRRLYQKFSRSEW